MRKRQLALESNPVQKLSENEPLMLEEISGLENTNENYYELAWSARHNIIMQKLSGIDDVQEALTTFRKLDNSFRLSLERVAGRLTEKDPVTTFFTCKVTATPYEPELANELFSRSEEAHRKQIDLILNSIDDEIDTVVELGAGYGGNLIRLDKASKELVGKSFKERGINLIMAEYTKSGRDLCSQFLKLDNAPQMEIHHIDHKAPDLSFLDPKASPLIVTVHSIEQVPHIPSNYFETLSRAAFNVRGIHLEPVGFQFEPGSPKWKEHEEFLKDMEWNQNFASVIKKAESDGHIKIDKVDTNFAAGQRENPTTLVSWHATS